jgi:hypothetical protein
VGTPAETARATETARAPRATRTSRAALLRAAAWLALALLVLAAAWREARQQSVQSDGASMVLQAWAMLHGNVLLRGWRLADVTFYTTELPVYMLIALFRGLRPGVVAISEAVNYTLTMACGALLAKGRATGREGAVRALLAAGVMCAPSLAAASWLLNDADHAATALWVLAALLVIDRAGRRWHVPVIVALVLAWAIVGDQLAGVIGSAPLILAGLARAVPGMFRGGTFRGKAWLRDRWLELSLAAAGAASVAAGVAATRAIAAAGGWQAVPVATKLALPARVLPALAAEARDFLALFSADFPGQRGAALAVAGIHVAGAAVVAAAVLLAAWRFGRREARGGDLIADVLLAGIAGDLGAYFLLYAPSPATIREVSPVFALGAVLAGRVLGGPLTRARLEPLLAAGIACYLLTMGPALAGRAAPPANSGLTGWLLRHRLSNGLAGYWQSNSVTLDSGGKITMRQVRGGSGGRPVVRLWETDTARLRPGGNTADFLVLTSGRTAPRPPVTIAGAEAEFGRPWHVWHYRDYTVLVWRENLLVPLAALSDGAPR